MRRNVELLKLVVFTVIAVIIELVLITGEKRRNVSPKPDPLALPYKAHRVDEPSFGYIPGRQTYDEKAKRYVIDWKYEWEYQGTTHTMMFCDNPFSQWENYLTTFPEEIDITINKNTGKHYVSKTARAASRSSLAKLLISLFLSGVITSIIFLFWHV